MTNVARNEQKRKARLVNKLIEFVSDVAIYYDRDIDIEERNNMRDTLMSHSEERLHTYLSAVQRTTDILNECLDMCFDDSIFNEYHNRKDAA